MYDPTYEGGNVNTLARDVTHIDVSTGFRFSIFIEKLWMRGLRECGQKKAQLALVCPCMCSCYTVAIMSQEGCGNWAITHLLA